MSFTTQGNPTVEDNTNIIGWQMIDSETCTVIENECELHYFKFIKNNRWPWRIWWWCEKTTVNLPSCTWTNSELINSILENKIGNKEFYYQKENTCEESKIYIYNDKDNKNINNKKVKSKKETCFDLTIPININARWFDKQEIFYEHYGLLPIQWKFDDSWFCFWTVESDWEFSCTDEFDNDEDGKIDCEDSNCDTQKHCLQPNMCPYSKKNCNFSISVSTSNECINHISDNKLLDISDIESIVETIDTIGGAVIQNATINKHFDQDILMKLENMCLNEKDCKKNPCCTCSTF